MANNICINKTDNTVSLVEQANSIVITDNNRNKTVNVSQPITSVVTVATLGPQGPQGYSVFTPISGNLYTASAILEVTGSIYVTDLIQSPSFSGSFTGSLFGTASWASNAITASYALNAPQSTSSSYALSASFATTASFVPNGVIGTGLSGRIPYWSSTNTLTHTANLLWDNPNARLRIAQAVDAGFRLDVGGTTRIAGATTIDSTLSLRASSGSAATHIPVFTADPSSTTRELVTRTPAQLLGDAGGVSGTGTSGQVAFWNGTSSQTGGSDFVWDNTAKILRINTTDGTANLSIGGSLNVGDGTTTYRIINSGGTAITGTTTNHGLVIRTNLITRINITAAGLVAIGNITPTQTLDVNGTGRIRNGVSLADTSGNVQIGTTTDAGFRLDVNGTARVTGNLTTNLTATRIPFIGTGGILSENANLSYSDSSNQILLHTLRLRGSDSDFFSVSTPIISATSGTGTSIPFTALGNLVLTARTNSTNRHIYIASFNGTDINWRWQFMDSGFLQSNGATTIRTSTGDLTIATNGGNGNITLFPNGTGNVQISSNTLIGTTTDAGFRLDVSGSTRIVPPANTTGLTLSGYSLTGSDATSAVNISGTWNTTGTPTLIFANLTDTASNASSNLLDLQVGSSSQFRVSKGGVIRLSNASTFNPVGTTTSDARILIAGGQGGAVGSVPLISLTTNNDITSTSGSPILVSIFRNFVPTSGTATYTLASISPTINQTGGANGITRGLFVNPTLTSAADWRSIEWSNNTGWGLYGAGLANNAILGSLSLGVLATPTARLQIRGTGNTSATTTLLVQNSTPTNLLTILDNGQFVYNTPTTVLPASSSAYAVNLNISQSALVGAQVYGVNISPTFFATTGSQTQTALRVNAVFTSSTAATSGSNIIADFGSTSAGSQLTVTDVTSGSIYMVNDVSGLPIIEATSDWTVNMYDFPNRVFRKTGSVIELGFQSTSSAVTFFADTILNEGLGFTHRTTQVSGSTVGAVTSSLWNINFGAISSSVYINAIVTGFDTGSRDIITGDIKATVRYRSGVASIVGFNQSFSNSDNTVVRFNITASSTSGSLQVFGTGSRTYQWGATVTTQVI